MTELSQPQLSKQLDEAIRLINSGETDKARSAFNEFINYETDNLDNLIRLGTIAINLDDYMQAVHYFTRVVEQQPDNARHLFSLSHAYTNLGEHEIAKHLLKKSIKNNPNQREALTRLGIYLRQENFYPDAVVLLEKAVALKPSDAEPYSDLIYSLSKLGRHEEALQYADKLIRIDPDNGISYTRKGRVLTEQGEIDDAIALYEKAIAVDKKCGLAYYLLGGVRKFSHEDKGFIEKTEKILETDLGSEQRSHIHFALGKMYSDCQDWNKAFMHFDKGNVIARSAVKPDSKRTRFKRVRKAIDKKMLGQARELGSDSETPVFIVGMPRSGTTLLESIISSHSDGAGAGELVDIAVISEQLFPEGKKIQEIRKNLTKDTLDEYAKSYLDKLRISRSEAIRIVDKMPFNFTNLGLIYMLFPNARVIHSIRNPLDTLLSCYVQSFRSFVESNDLLWLADLYRLYQEAMNYWKKVLPRGYIMDVHYEDVVSDPENTIRQLVDFCGLPWDDACLQHHSNKRVISTSSMWQARQPIYKTSKKRWVNYAPYLKDLAVDIRDYLVAEDITEFENQGIKLGGKFGMGLFK